MSGKQVFRRFHLKPWRIHSRNILFAFSGLLFPALLYQRVPDNPPHREMLGTARVSENVRAILERSCRDCHSDNTRWPWYTQIRPIGQVIKSDVEAGRRFMNLSRWETYSRGRKIGYLVAMGSAATVDRMPPPKYVLIHPSAKLSDEDRRMIAQWALGERSRLQVRSVR